jgi:hypothetical protein
MRWLPLLALGLFACASANVGGNNDDDDDDVPKDAPDPNDPDAPDAAPLIDAGVTQTLVQATNNTNTASNSATCPNGENSWYRVFTLTDSGITGGFNVTQVTFGAQEAALSPVLQIKLGLYAGAVGGTTLDLAQVTAVNATTMTIPNTANPGNNVVVPITGFVPAGSSLIVEIFNPSNNGTKFFFIGASNGGETKPGYVRGPSCNNGGVPITIPTSTAAIGLPASNLNITVTGIR